jgi:magnesium transporter
MTAQALSPTSALVARFIARFPEDAARALQDVEAAEAAPLVAALNPSHAAGLLARLGPDSAVAVLDTMDESAALAVVSAADPFAAIRWIPRLDDDRRRAVLAGLPALRAAEIARLLEYPDDSAGRLMDPAAPVFRDDARTSAVEAAIRERDRGDDPVVVVVDQQGRLRGTLSMARILLAEPGRRLSDLPIDPTPAVEALDHRTDVADVLTAHHLGTLPVVDAEGRPLGLLRHRALVDVAEQEVTADMQSMVGVSREERALSPVSFAVRKRLPWLQINLATAFLAAAVVGLFESTIAQFSVLAVLLPVVAGQSGNTGAQSLAVTMRGLTLREISLSTGLRVLMKESLVGLLNGVAVAAVTMAGVYVWSGSPGLCAVIGLSMVLSMAVAAVAGASVPLVLTAARQDPAQSSSIILTTVTDVVGFSSFLGLATILAAIL